MGGKSVLFYVGPGEFRYNEPHPGSGVDLPLLVYGTHPWNILDYCVGFGDMLI